MALLLVAGALSAPAGCGGDDEPAAETVAPPELSVPGEPATSDETETTSESEATQTVPAPPPPAQTTAPEPPPPPPDSPENDQPPPEDSPAERFEQYCDQNPGAC